MSAQCNRPFNIQAAIRSGWTTSARETLFSASVKRSTILSGVLSSLSEFFGREFDDHKSEGLRSWLAPPRVAAPGSDSLEYGCDWDRRRALRRLDVGDLLLELLLASRGSALDLFAPLTARLAFLRALSLLCACASLAALSARCISAKACSARVCCDLASSAAIFASCSFRSAASNRCSARRY